MLGVALLYHLFVWPYRCFYQNALEAILSLSSIVFVAAAYAVYTANGPSGSPTSTLAATSLITILLVPGAIYLTYLAHSLPHSLAGFGRRALACSKL